MIVTKVIGVLALATFVCAQLEEVFEWKQLDFAWPNATVKENAIKSNDYVPNNNLPLGIKKWKNKLFVTVPRWKAGVAASLTYIDTNTKEKTPVLRPYPSWEANLLPASEESAKENSIISVFRVDVDACDRLWVMDTGLADILGNPKQISKPALAIFDLNTDKLIRRYEFKATDLKEDSFFANVVVDGTPETCNKAYAYIPDLGGYGVVVYSFEENDSWRISHNFFHFDPLKGDLTVGGVNFQWTDGVFGLALSEMHPDGFRTMYFHCLASTKEFSVSTHVLQNKTLATDPHSYFEFKLVGERGDRTQATTGAYDQKRKVLFLTQLNKDGVACWNSKKSLIPENVGLIAQDPEKLVFTNDIFVDDDYLYMISDKMSVFLYKELDPQEVNYRILRTNITQSIQKTPCL